MTAPLHDGCSARADTTVVLSGHGDLRRRLFASLALALLTLSIVAVGASCTKKQRIVSAAEASSVTVYLTRTGKRYHDEGCSSLSKSKRAVTLEYAAPRFGPCANCRPPIIRTR
jgi:hypothetical protein